MRTEVKPPHRRAASWRGRLGAWLNSGDDDSIRSSGFGDRRPAAHKDTALAEARTAFRAALQDIPPLKTAACLEHIRAARSLHELWHLRSEVFSLVSCHHSQFEADSRLGVLDRHFPSRDRRPGFSASVPPV